MYLKILMFVYFCEILFLKDYTHRTKERGMFPMFLGYKGQLPHSYELPQTQQSKLFFLQRGWQNLPYVVICYIAKGR